MGEENHFFLFGMREESVGRKENEVYFPFLLVSPNWRENGKKILLFIFILQFYPYYIILLFTYYFKT